MLTLLLANELNEPHQLADLRALTQAALGAAQLPRHKQEQLGRLCRIAVREGDQAAALEALGSMTVDPPDIESDSELRVSAAAVATLGHDSQLVLSLLGPTTTSVPIEAGLQPLAIVLRTHALETLGQMPAATAALRDLPHIGMLTEYNKAYPHLELCPRSAASYDELGDSPHRNLAAPLGTVLVLGVLFLTCFIGVVAAFILSDDPGPKGFDAFMLWFCLGLLVILGVPFTLGGISARRRVTFLRRHGHARRGRVIQVEGTGSSIGPIPIYNLTLELIGPAGPYRVQVRKTLHAPEASSIVGKTLPILANPSVPTDAILDELELV